MLRLSALYEVIIAIPSADRRAMWRIVASSY